MSINRNSLTLDVVVLSHNRPKLLKRAMLAIDNVDFGISVNKIVSDNSSNHSEVRGVIENDWIIKERNSRISWIQHFILNLNECKSDWILITNDDDEILEEFGRWFSFNIDNTSINVITGGTNTVNGQGVFVKNEGYTNRFTKSKISAKEIYSSEEFLRMIMRFGSLFPFSGIALKAEIIETLNLASPEKYGFAFDYFFALELCVSGKNKNSLIAYKSNESIINYFIHGEQLSSEHSMRYRLLGESLLCRLNVVSREKYDFSNAEFLVLFAQILISRSVASSGNQTDLLDLIDDMFKNSFNKCLKFKLLKIANKFPVILAHFFYELYTIYDKVFWKFRSKFRSK
jgi:hypothetical protein